MGNNNATKPDQKQGKNNELPVETKPRNQLKSLFRNPIVKSDFFQLKANAFSGNKPTYYKDYDGGCTTCCDGCPNSQQASSARRDPYRDSRSPPKSSQAWHEGSRRRGSMSCEASMEYNNCCDNQCPNSGMHKNRYNDNYNNPPPDAGMRDPRYNDRYQNSQPPESEIRERCCCDSNNKKQKKPKLKPQPRDPPPYEMSCRRKSIAPEINQSFNDLRQRSPQPQPSRREREVYSDSSYCYGGPCSSRQAAYNSSPPPPPPPKPKPNPRRTRSLSDCECKGKKLRQPADCATDYMEYRDFKTLAHYSPLVVKSKTPPKAEVKDKQDSRSYQVSKKSSKTVVCACPREVDSIPCPYLSQQSHSNESLAPPPRPPSKNYPLSRSASGYKICRENCCYKNYPHTSSNRNEFSKQSSPYSPNSRGQMSPQPKLKSARTPTKNRPQRSQNIGLNTDHVGPVQCLCNLGSNGVKRKSTSQSKRGGGGVSNREYVRPRQKNRLPAGSPSCSKRATLSSRPSAHKIKSLLTSALKSSRNHPIPYFSTPLVRKTSSTPTILNFFKMRRIPHLNPSCNRIRGGRLTPVNKDFRPGITRNTRAVDVQSTTIIQNTRRQPGPRSSSAATRRTPQSRNKPRNLVRAPSAPPATRVNRVEELPTTSVKARQNQKQEKGHMQEILAPPERFMQAENVELPTQSIGLVPTSNVAWNPCMESFYRGSFLAIRACVIDDGQGQEQPRAHYSKLTLTTAQPVLNQCTFDQVTESLRKEFEQLQRSKLSSHKSRWTWIKMLPKWLFNGKKRS